MAGSSHQAGISTNGVKVGYAFETTAGTKPTAFTQILRVNAADEIAIETETIDASATDDKTTRTIAGRGDTGGTFGVTINMTDETIDQWTNIIEEYETAKAEGKSMWYEEYYPDIKKAYFAKVEPPSKIPKPSLEQNGLATFTMNLTINDYLGTDTAIEPTDPGQIGD